MEVLEGMSGLETCQRNKGREVQVYVFGGMTKGLLQLCDQRSPATMRPEVSLSHAAM